MSDASALLGVSIRGYKNLREVWLPWSNGLALFGPNGAGKTNLLECLALLFGSDLTVDLARPRIKNPASDSLAFVARVPHTLLPWSPELTLRWAARGEEADNARLAALQRAAADGRWWELMGAKGGSDHQSGLVSAGLPDAVVRLVRTAMAVPRVRYGLEKIDTLARPVTRSFSRTLMTEEVPAEVQALVDDLPDLFAPLRATASPSDSSRGLIPLLELPPSSSAPFTLQWLPRARSSEEATFELDNAFERASSPVRSLAETLGELHLEPPQDNDWHWWLHQLGQQWAAEELESLRFGISVKAVGGDDADFDIYGGGGDESHRISDTRGTGVLDPLSAGERRWVDEALATVSREYERFGRAAEAHWQAFFELDDDQRLAATRDTVESVAGTVALHEYWPGEVFDQLLQVLEPALLAAERTRLQRADDDLMRAILLERDPGLALPGANTVIRVFDEPEAHLHISAQIAVANHLQTLRHSGQNVVIATHSAPFLDLQGWGQVAVSAARRGARVTPLSTEASTTRTSLARELGINRGELLAGIQGVVIVEGVHDALVLDRLFGDDLRAARLAILRMYGTNHLLALAELDFIERYLDVSTAVILDYTRAERVAAGEWMTEEERKLVELQRARGDASFHVIGLERPDIVCYLPDDAIRYTFGEFAGWQAVLEAFSTMPRRPPFKSWLRREFGVDLRTAKQIEKVLQQMALNSLSPVDELARKLNELIASWSSVNPS